MAELETVTRTIELRPGAVFPFGAEKVLWRVLELDREAGTMLVIADKEICEKEYHKKDESVTWETCTLRKWLNGEYLEKTFNAQEQDAIRECTIHTPDNAKYGTKGGNDTQDKLFLLSLDEVQKYFKDDEARATGFWWWLRSPGRSQRSAAYVYDDGSVRVNGYRVSSDNGGIRPAFYINLNSELFQSIISESSESFTITVPQQRVMAEIELKPGAWFPMGRHGGLWRILDVNREAETALVIAEETVGARAYHQPGGDITWEKSTLRSWLNGEYIANEFSAEEQEAIRETDVKNPGNAKYNTKGGNDTKDKLFLLSLDEVQKYFKSDADRATGSWWWLRSPGFDQRYAAYVSYGGSVNDGGYDVNYDLGGIRPAFNINLSSIFFQSFLSSDPKSKIQTIRVPEMTVKDGKIIKTAKCLEEVHVPEGVETISDEDFAHMPHLQEVHLPSTVKQVGKYGLEDLTGKYLRAGENLLWANGQLLGTGIREITIPEGVTKIEDETFRNCANLETVRLPSTLEKIGAEAFENCGALKTVQCPSETVSYGKDAFSGCRKLKYSAELFRTRGKLCDSFSEHMESCGAEELARVWLYQSGKSWESARVERLTGENIPEVLNAMTAEFAGLPKVSKKQAGIPADFAVRNAPVFSDAQIQSLCDTLRQKKNAATADAILAEFAGIREYREKLSVSLPETRKEDGSVTLGSAEKEGLELSVRYGVLQQIELKGDQSVAIELPPYVRETASHSVKNLPHLTAFTWTAENFKLDKETFSNCPNLRLAPEIYVEAKKPEKNFAPYVPDDVETAAYLLTSQDDVLFWLKAVSAHLSAEHTKEVIARMRERMPGAEDPAALFACGGYAEMYRDSWVDASDYKKGALDTYHRLASADAIAEESDHAAMMVWLTKKIKSSDCWYAPYAVYADEKELAGLLSEMKAWPKEGKAGKERTIRVRGAILLNETNDAMRYADSLGLLGRYAELRGLDEDTLRDTRMDELGLDEDGRRSWMLAGKTYTAVLNPDLTLSLLDESGKVIRSLPKKDADPEAYAAADKELKALKKDLKPTAKQRNAKIFADFLSGAERRSEDWKKIYLQELICKG